MKRKKFFAKLKEKVGQLQKLKTPPTNPTTSDRPTVTEADLFLLVEDSLVRYEQSCKWWNMLLYSLPLDFLLFLAARRFTVDMAFLRYLEFGFYGLLLLSLSILFREEIITLIIQLNGFQQKIQSKTKSIAPYLALVVPVIVMIDITLKISAFGIIPIVLLLLIVVVQYPKIKAEFLSHIKPDDLSHTEIQFQKAQSINQQLSGVVIGSCIFVRAASALGAVYIGASSHPDNHVLLMLIAILLIFLIAAPEQDEFLSHCKRCAAKTARAFRDTFYCPNCSGKKYKKQTGYRR